MKKALLFMLAICLCILQSPGQEKKDSKFLVGFNASLPRGMSSATALTNSPEPISKSYGLGVLLQRKISGGFSIFLDGNAYNYNTFLAKQGADVQTIWSVAESATHWDEAGAPHIQYVHNLPTDVHFDMQSAGFRLGAKYAFGEKKMRPWVGAGLGYYTWTVNYFNAEKDQTYGKDNGSATGLTYLLGVDFDLFEGTSVGIFGDFGTPIAKYEIEGLFYPQWDIKDYEAQVLGSYRLGLTLSFSPRKK